jgi:CHASE2 domain-containing sensor protein
MIGIYLLINHNLFSWYALWLLPLIALEIELRPVRPNIALAGWVLTGTLALSYVFFVAGRVEQWAIWAQFIPVYALLLAAGGFAIERILRTRRTARHPFITLESG